MSLKSFRRAAVTGCAFLAVFALTACESPNGGAHGTSSGGGTEDAKESDAAGKVVLSDPDDTGTPRVRVADVDRDELRTSGTVRYYLENVSGQHLEDLSFYVQFLHPPREGEIVLDFSSEVTTEQPLVLNRADARKEIVATSSTDDPAAILGTKIWVENQAPRPTTPGTRFIAGAIEFVAMDGLFSAPSFLTVELANVSDRNVGSLEIQAVYLRGKEKVISTTWQPVPDIPSGTRVSMSLDLPEADRLPHDVQIKIRPGSVF